MIAATWWGHSSVSLELGATRLFLDPLLTARLAHLRRRHPVPPASCATADVVLVSHLHGDHLHVPSLRRFPADALLVVPRGAAPLLRGLPQRYVEAEPGDRIDLDEVSLEILPAHHDGRRWAGSRRRGPALGFRIESAEGTCWYPGDTGLFDQLRDVSPVDLALVPIGGWGPTLGDEHLDPVEACEAVGRVGARHVVPVHYGTYWPVGMTLARRTHDRLFVRPAELFEQQMTERLPEVRVHVPRPGERVQLPPGR